MPGHLEQGQMLRDFTRDTKGYHSPLMILEMSQAPPLAIFHTGFNLSLSYTCSHCIMSFVNRYRNISPCCSTVAEKRSIHEILIMYVAA